MRSRTANSRAAGSFNSTPYSTPEDGQLPPKHVMLCNKEKKQCEYEYTKVVAVPK
jgi:hypothetical protein